MHTNNFQTWLERFYPSQAARSQVPPTPPQHPEPVRMPDTPEAAA